MHGRAFLRKRISGAVHAVRPWLRARDRALSVTLKLLLPPAVGILVVAGIYGAAAIVLIREELDAAYRDGARGLAFSLQAEYAKDRGQAEALTVFVRELVASDPTVVRVRFYRVVDGRPVVWASSQPTGVGADGPDPSDIAPLETGKTAHAEERLDGAPVLETVHPLTLDGRMDATVGIYTSLRARDAAVARSVWTLALTVVPGGIALGAALAIVAELIVLRRLRRMRRAAEAVAAGDLSVRLPEGEEPPARDEIVAVARQFDHMVRAVAEQQAQMEHLAVTDRLTGLLNRRGFDAQLGSEIERAKRLGYTLTLSLLDLDGFKAVNDSLGHLAGDDALRRVAQVLASAVRRSDVVARYGGDEFAVIHPGCDAGAAIAVGARARAAVEGLDIRARDGRLLSASLGVAEQRVGSTAAELIAATDTALYRAKARGGGIEVARATDVKEG